MTLRKLKFYRIYFNTHAQNGCVWSIDEGDISSEFNVRAVWIETFCVSGYLHGSDNLRNPRAWLETTAILVLEEGKAYFFPPGQESMPVPAMAGANANCSHAELVH